MGFLTNEAYLVLLGNVKPMFEAGLLAQLGVNASRSAAEALANANTTVQQSPLGTKEAFMSGEMREFVAGKSIASTGNSLADWLTSRASQEFDAVFVPTDQSVAIHVDQALSIDYEVEGRKLSYVEPDATYY